MIKREFQLQLNTPAFLGDADQKGVWRTPPLKALLREWWRVAVAAEVGFDSGRLKARETVLFGTAADEGGGDNRQSRIRLALGHWNEGKLREHKPLPTIYHPEAERAKCQVEPLNYLGYGPIDRGRLKFGAALQADETNSLKLVYTTDWPGKSIAYPEDVAEHLARALMLAHWFGTVGGRSRNGWGSLAFAPMDGTPALPALTRARLEQSGCVRPLARCLELDWPHALGTDQAGPLVWQSAERFDNWREAMKFLARVKIGFRTHLGFTGGQPHPVAQDRHVLAYPVTNHKVPSWEGLNKGRLANTLRFKLRAAGDGRLRAVVYHTPCQPTPTLPYRGIDLVDTWRRVHRWLDEPATRQDAFRDMKLTRLA